MSGFQSSIDTNQLVFSKKRKRTHNYLPSSIKKIAETLNLDNKDLLKEHSLYPLYAYFLSSEKKQYLYSLMLDECKCVPTNVIDSKSNLSVNNTFDFCPICLQEDIDNYGVPYWHIEQQLPGIEVCSRHNCQLQKVEGGDHGLGNRYALPFRVYPRQNKNTNLFMFSSYCNEFFNWVKSGNQITPAVLFSRILNELSMLRGEGSLNMQKLESQIFDRERISSFGLNRYIKLPQIFRILRHPDEDFNPMKHLAVLFLLCDSIKDIKEIAESPQRPQTAPFNKKVQLLDPEILKLNGTGLSMNAIGKTLSISRTLVKRVLKSNGKLPLSSLESSVCNLGRKGIHRTEISKKLNISVGYVEQILSMVANLPSMRKGIKAENKEKQYKMAMEELIKNNPSFHRKDIKLSLNKEFYWLYAHCRVWLESRLPAPMRPYRYLKTQEELK